MKSYSFYDESTGLFDPTIVITSMQAPTHPTLKRVEGEFDHRNQRMDLATGKVVDYQPPQPSEDHEWNADNKRWWLRPEVEERINASIAARAEIDALEAKEHRYIAESALGTIDDEGKRRFAALRARIVELRKVLL